MINRNMIRPAVRRLIDLSGGAVTIPVPTGEVWEIYAIQPDNVTDLQNFILSVGEKIMFWGPAATGDWNPFSDIDARYGDLTRKLKIPFHTNQLPVIVDEGQNVVVESSDNTGMVRLNWRVHDKLTGRSRFDDGARDARRRMMLTWGQYSTSVPIGANQWAVVDVSMNPPGQTRFPWEDPVYPDRRYFLLAAYWAKVYAWDTDLTWDAFRITHEGRDIVTQPTIIESPASAWDESLDTAHVGKIIFPEPYGIDSNEVLQWWLRFQNVGQAPIDPLVRVAFLCIEEFLTNDVTRGGII